MLAIPLLLAPLAFLGGLYVVGLVAPPLGTNRSARVATRIVDILGGAAAVVVVLNAYSTIRLATQAGFNESDTYVAGYITQTLWQAGLLIATAAIVHLLACAREDRID